MLTDELVAKAVRHHYRLTLHPGVREWFAVNTFAARYPAPTLVKDDDDEDEPEVVENQLLVDIVQRYCSRMNWVQEVFEVVDLRAPAREAPVDPRVRLSTDDASYGERIYCAATPVTPGRTVTKTKIQDRFGQLLDGYKVWRGVAQASHDVKDPSQWPLLGVNEADEVVLIIMPMRH